MEARLQAVLSKNMYSLHGLLALMRPSSGHVCQSLMVVSYCTPGSAQDHAAYPISSQSMRALGVLGGRGAPPSSPAWRSPVRQYRFQSPSFDTASNKSCGTRMELFE